MPLRPRRIAPTALLALVLPAASACGLAPADRSPSRPGEAPPTAPAEATDTPFTPFPMVNGDLDPAIGTAPPDDLPPDDLPPDDLPTSDLPLPEDDARIVGAEMPIALACGQSTTATIVVENTGTTTWTRADEFKLGAVDDSDPLNGDGRVYLDEGVVVAPGASHAFVVALAAPSTEGTYATDWRMVHELVNWFGETITQQVVVECPERPRRTGVVRVENKALVDDQGAFHALGTSLFWALWGYQNDRARLEQNLAYLADNGFDYIRVLGVVGDPNGPDYWDGREAVFAWPDYAEAIRGLTDLAYDSYGLRVQWTLIGDGQVSVPTEVERYALVDAFVAMAADGRAHKVILFEIANEAWQNGFGGDDGIAQLRELSSYMKGATDVLVAASAPEGASCEDMLLVYEGDVADVATIHFDRNVSLVDGPWRPVRQPWGLEGECNLGIVGNNNEPIGPGSSVASEIDVERLVAGAIATYVANIPFYVFHTRAGIRGDDDIWNMAGASSFTHVKDLVPNDVTSWSRRNAYMNGHPFIVFAGDESGTLYADDMWPDFGGSASSGVVRMYGQIAGDRFFTFPMGIKNFVELEARYGLDYEVRHPLTGELVQQGSLDQGAHLRLEGAGAFVVTGTFH